MKNTSHVRANLALALALATTMVSAHAGDLTLPAWLAGCWEQEKGERGSLEMWMPAAADAMLGTSRTVRNGKTVAHEFMQIRVQSNALVFIALPSNQREATFTAVRNLEREIVFENLQHDFPQRIIYRRTGADALSARVEGMREGKLRGIDYSFKKVSCD